MIGVWMLYVAAGLALGFLGLWFQHGNGRKKLRKWRGMAFGRSMLVIRETWHHHHYQRTPRARLRAERKQEPLRWTFGHQRRPDDPTLTRRAARKAKDAGGRGVDRAKLSWANRTPISERLERRNTHRDMGPQMMCGSTRTENGHPCRNPRMIGKDHCQVHPKVSLGFSRRDEDGMSRWERRRLKREQEAEEKRWAEQEARRRDRQDRDRERDRERQEDQLRERSDRNGDGNRDGSSGWFSDRDRDRDREQQDDLAENRNGDGPGQPVSGDGGSPQPVGTGSDGAGD